MITLQGTNKTTRLKVIYYDKYNITEQSKNNQKTIKKQSKNNNISNNKELEEIKSNNAFEILWKTYPLKKSKKKSETAFNRLTKKNQKLLIEALPNYINSVEDIKYLKHLSTYINQECWNDEFISNIKPIETELTKAQIEMGFGQ